jgi:alkylhydroperoxidase family enzyme
VAPAASKADVAEHLGQAGSIPVRLRQLVVRPGPCVPAGRPGTTTSEEAPAVARIPLVSGDDPDADPKARELLGLVRQSRGREVNVYRGIANHPEILEAVLKLGQVAYFANSLDPVQRELAYYTSAVTNECFY